MQARLLCHASLFALTTCMTVRAALPYAPRTPVTASIVPALVIGTYRSVCQFQQNANASLAVITYWYVRFATAWCSQG